MLTSVQKKYLQIRLPWIKNNLHFLPPLLLRKSEVRGESFRKFLLQVCSKNTALLGSSRWWGCLRRQTLSGKFAYLRYRHCWKNSNYLLILFWKIVNFKNFEMSANYIKIICVIICVYKHLERKKNCSIFNVLLLFFISKTCFLSKSKCISVP